MLKRDEKLTGRLDVTLFYKNPHPTASSVGVKIHEKKLGYARDNFKGFD